MPDATCSLAIAGLGVTIHSDDAALIDRLRAAYRAFLSDGDAHLTAHVHHIGRQPATNDKPAIFDDGVLHFTAPNYTGFIDIAHHHGELSFSTTRPFEEVDYFLRAAYALLAFHAGGLLFHAAGIARGERGYLFFGHSGSGKTTVARVSSQDVVLNDDLVLLLPASRADEVGEPGHGWFIHATPFSNPAQFAPSGPQHVPLAGLFRLVQDQSVYIEDLPAGQAIAEVVSNAPVISIDPARSLALIDRAQCLLHAVPAARLHFLPDDSFWAVIDQSMG